MNSKIEIINFSPELKEPIKTLNFEWLEKHFQIEEVDLILLSNPQEEIIDKGGFIFYAKLNDQIVGTASLLKKNDAVFELGKMAVTAQSRGYGIGNLLLEHSLDFAKQKGIQKIILYSNTALEAAINLYRKYGFVEIELENGIYNRANIKMEKLIPEA